MIEYKIYESVYNDIISGKKNIEYRLLNEKSNNIKVGDYIKFTIEDDSRNIVVIVTNKYIYKDIDDLLLNSSLSYSKEELENLFNKIFGEEKVKSSKIVGIEFKIKDEIYE